MSRISRAAILVLATLGLPVAAAGIGPAHAEPGDVLYVQGDRVNLRAGPGTGEPVVMQLDKGRAVTEHARRGDWVEVAIPEAGAGRGWIHKSLVGPSAGPSGLPPPPADPKFEVFEAALRALNERTQRRLGAAAFSRAENLGGGALTLTATPAWLAAPEADRRDDLAALFRAWGDAQDPEVPIVLKVVDTGGKVVMEQGRE